MPPMVTVDIEIPDGMLLEGSQLPNDYTVQEVIDELVDSLELPRTADNGENITYSLTVANRNLSLTASQLIGNAGIYDGDTIKLLASHRISTPSSLPPTVLGTTPGDEISVVLSVLDLNRSETVNLSTTRKVGDLIRQIVQNYELPARDKLNQLIKYRLQSKALGRFLEETTTLAEAHIPVLDRLALHREEIAGA